MNVDAAEVKRAQVRGQDNSANVPPGPLCVGCSRLQRRRDRLGRVRAGDRFGRRLRRALAAVQWRDHPARGPDCDPHRVLAPADERRGAGRGRFPADLDVACLPSRPSCTIGSRAVALLHAHGGWCRRRPRVVPACCRQRQLCAGDVSGRSPRQHVHAARVPDGDRLVALGGRAASPRGPSRPCVVSGAACAWAC